MPVIGTIRTPFGSKFAVPRQGGGNCPAHGRVILEPPYSAPSAVKGLEGFSHLHLIFHFHLAGPGPFHATVRPPRLGGNTRLGVFATRSPYRPSRLGLSVVRLLGVEVQAGRAQLVVEGVDLVDGTPIIDIKPYLPRFDAIPGASAGFAGGPPPSLGVEVAPGAQARFGALPRAERESILAILAQDPRPAYRGAGDGHRYGATLFGHNIVFFLDGGRILITAVED
ncbi:MAG: tRNA (N6-threonylcarbamoyladenosine(37)-N6)-methyltransferase TrmO [Succinivibrionaceae bacterium]|nr:tRNA (N6-threonylcarbamoyladenosine(37)-N6)-methyltransferase TrmO [Succinivibrionaceae bacterium]